MSRIVLHNPNAGSLWRAGRMRRVLDVLAALPGTRLVATKRTRISAQTRDLLSDDVSAVFACGGDGTVSDVAAGITGTDIALGIVPCGTTNTLAFEFGIPPNPFRAIEMLATSAARRPMHTWSVGESRLVLGVGVGWDAQLMWRTPSALKRRLGYFAFTPIGVSLALRYEFPELLVEGTDAHGADVTVTGSSVLVANSRHWAGPHAVFPAADPSSELLQVIVLERPSLAQLTSFWLHMMLPGGSPLSVAGVRVVALRRLRISAVGPRPVEVHVNGDPVARTPVSIEPSGVVQVIVPGRVEDPRAVAPRA